MLKVFLANDLQVNLIETLEKWLFFQNPLESAQVEANEHFERVAEFEEMEGVCLSFNKDFEIVAKVCE